MGGKKQKTPGARRRLFVNPPTPPHAPARCRAEARCRPGSKREGNTSWKTPGARPGSRDSSDTPTRSGEVSIRGALLPRQQARTKYELGGPRLHPRGAVRAGPTPEIERSDCLRLPEESSLIGQARRSPAPRVPANEPSRAIHSRQPSPHFTVFQKIVTTITSDLREKPSPHRQNLLGLQDFGGGRAVIVDGNLKIF